MALYSYIVEHDFGLAPNPFGEYCTLAVCKPKIRKSKLLSVDNWIIGTGSRALEKVTGKNFRNRLIYAMKVQEIISMQQYWEDSRFEYKKPILNGPLVVMYGDNFYHKNDKNEWVQEDSAHSNADGTPNIKHLKSDTTGENVLISKLFYYFGQEAPVIPDQLNLICHSGVGEKKITNKLEDDFIKWLEGGYKPGIYGDPVNWIQYSK